jgi:hypothetical protein
MPYIRVAVAYKDGTLRCPEDGCDFATKCNLKLVNHVRNQRQYQRKMYHRETHLFRVDVLYTETSKLSSKSEGCNRQTRLFSSEFSSKALTVVEKVALDESPEHLQSSSAYVQVRQSVPKSLQSELQLVADHGTQVQQSGRVMEVRAEAEGKDAATQAEATPPITDDASPMVRVCSMCLSVLSSKQVKLCLWCLKLTTQASRTKQFAHCRRLLQQISSWCCSQVT